MLRNGHTLKFGGFSKTSIKKQWTQLHLNDTTICILPDLLNNWIIVETNDLTFTKITLITVQVSSNLCHPNRENVILWENYKNNLCHTNSENVMIWENTKNIYALLNSENVMIWETKLPHTYACHADILNNNLKLKVSILHMGMMHEKLNRVRSDHHLKFIITNNIQ